MASVRNGDCPTGRNCSTGARRAGWAGAACLAPSRLTVLIVGDREQVEQPLRELGCGLTLLDAEGVAPLAQRVSSPARMQHAVKRGSRRRRG